MVKVIESIFYENVIFFGYNGFIGLGDVLEDLVGCDWKFIGGDFGDLDFIDVIIKFCELGKKIFLVVFGYMYYRLCYIDKQLCKCVDIDIEGILYLNVVSVLWIVDSEG